MNPVDIEMLVVVTSIQPFLLAWIASICFFICLALTAMISPGRRWFELVVIFGLSFSVTMLLAIGLVQGVFGVHIFRFEAAELMRIETQIFPDS